jgi:hypothetical protein
MPGTMISRGNLVASWLMGPTLTPVLVAQATTAEQDFTVKGLQVGDFVNVVANVAQTAGIGIANARVKAADTLTIGFSNSTAGGLTPAAGVYLVMLDRAETTLPAERGVAMYDSTFTPEGPDDPRHDLRRAGAPDDG